MPELQKESRLRLVVDANILFSALIKDGYTSDLLFEKQLKLFSTNFLLEEFSKHKVYIFEKSLRNETHFVRILHCLQDIITVMQTQEYSNFMDYAEKISPDEKDVHYFALALKLKCAIWSNDKKLKEQNIVKIYSTDEIREIL